MRVLFVSPAAELGGAERCLLDCIAALHQDRRIQVDLIALADGPLLGRARALGATAQVIAPPRKLALLGESGSLLESGTAVLDVLSKAPEVGRFLARLRRAVAAADPDVVHTNGMKAHLLAGLTAPRRARLVVHLHDFVGARRASKWLLPALHHVRQQTAFIAISRAVAQDFARLAPKAEIHTIYNVVDTNYFHEGAAEPDWLAKLGGLEFLAAKTTTFGLIATYARWKGHGLFIEAAGLLKKTHPEALVHFYVVGGPIYETVGSQVHAAELIQQARAVGLGPNFSLVPFQDDIARVYRALDVVVHASTEPEPFGRTIVEAMACARSVVVARAGGAAELFDDDDNAIGFEPGNVTQLAEAMTRQLDPDMRRKLGRSAREHALLRFNRSRLAAELLRVYSPNAK